MKDRADFILGVDGGATKTIARLIHLESNKVWEESGGPSSLTNDYQGAVDTLEALCASLCLKARCSLNNTVAVFGLAGACNDLHVAKLAHTFKHRFYGLEICTDAKTSVYGANKGLPVAAIALGTGSVGMRLDEDDKTTLVGGWGFLLGDEGGGAKLGLHAIQAAMREIQVYGQCKSPLVLSIVKKTGANRTSILNWSAQAKPIDFARYAPLVFQHYMGCQVAEGVMKMHLKSVEELIRDTRSTTNLPVVLLGSLGEPTYKLLSKDTQNIILKAKGSALDGACLLARKTRENIHNKIKEIKTNDYAG